MSYPLKTQIAERAVTLDNPRHLPAHVDALLAQNSRDVIMAQSFADRFARCQSTMIGSGEIWLGAVCAARECSARPLLSTACNPAAGEAPIACTPGSAWREVRRGCRLCS